MLRRPPRSTRTDTLFPTRRSSDLKFNGAARFTDDRTGSIWSWKLGLINQVTTGVELRATYSRDIRSPNLLELYSGQVLTLLNITDPQRNNDTYQIRSFAGGHPNRSEERREGKGGVSKCRSRW